MHNRLFNLNFKKINKLESKKSPSVIKFKNQQFANKTAVYLFF